MDGDPTIHGGEGDYGTTGIWEDITGTLGGLVHSAGDYIQERFFGDKQRGQDQPYYKDWTGHTPPGKEMDSKRTYQGFQFDSIAALWIVGAVGAVATIVYIARR